MTHLEHAQQLRACTAPHYNCCQSVLVPFAQEMGLTEEQANALGTHFAAGMRHGSTCGAITGALMVLGSLGYDEKQAAALLQHFRQSHQATDCATLLKLSHDRGEAKKDHCDGLVYEAIQVLEEILERNS
jgi:C_GCAxxG_C_C family probable redox protein